MHRDPRDVLTRPAPTPDATVAYGSLPDQVVDVWLPGPAAPPRPLVIAVHGGFWRAEYDRGHLGPLASALAGDGWPTAVIEYRRVGQPGGGWPGTFDDVSAAVRRTPELLADLCGARPTGPPILLGHSAGGQLALWCAAASKVPTRSMRHARDSAPSARGVVALAPVADLAAAYELDLDGGAVAELLGGGPAEVPRRYAEADPCARLPVPVPVVVVHGDRDAEVPIALSRAYRSAAEAVGGRVTLVELAGVEHFALIDPLSAAWPSVTSALRSLP